MCMPVIVGIGIAATAAAGGISAYGQYQEGETQDKYYKYLAEQNEREAEAAMQTAEQRTTIAQNEAAQQAKELKGDVSRIIGGQKVAMAASGILGVTAEDILQDTINRAKLDEANIRYNADITSWAAKKEAIEQGWALRNQSTLFRFAGKQAKRAAMINMTTTLLGTASSILMGGGALSKGGGGGGATTGGRGGQIIETQQYGKTWSPYRL